MRVGIAIPALLVAQFVAPRLAAQQQPIKVKGGHELGETAEQFFSEGREKDVLAACAAGNFKAVGKSTRKESKLFCAMIMDIRHRATSGSHVDYESGGDPAEVREDTFTFDGGHLAKVQLQYGVPGPESNYRGLTFEQILAGVKQDYGPPSRESSDQVRNVYGVNFTTHTDLWLRPDAALLITQQIASPASTTLTAFTRAEYEQSLGPNARAPDPLK
jgi:hypothetical protein